MAHKEAYPTHVTPVHTLHTPIWARIACHDTFILLTSYYKQRVKGRFHWYRKKLVHFLF